MNQEADRGTNFVPLNTNENKQEICNVQPEDGKELARMPYEDQYGRLRVKVSTGNGALPVKNSAVTIYRPIEVDGVSQNYLMGFFETDNNGESPAIFLPTPNEANSLNPLLPAAALYYVDVNRPGYLPETNLQVSVFPHVEGFLQVNLIPQEL